MTSLPKFAALCLITVSPLAAGQQFAIPKEFQDPFTTVTFRADSQEKTGEIYRLAGSVKVTYQQATLTAGRATYNERTGEVEASGSVSFTDPKAHFDADRGTYNIITGAAVLINADGYVDPPLRERPGVFPENNVFYIRAREVDRLNENTYVVQDGRLTSCGDHCLGWSLSVHRARVTVGDKAVSYGDVFRFLDVPMLYAPVMEHSAARRPRQTGFLIPAIGNSSQKGRIIGDAFFWAINPSADLLIGAEDYSLRGLATMARFRARPSDTSLLQVDYFGVNDHGSGPLRSQRAPGESINAYGAAQDLAGFRGVLDMDYVNSLAFRLTYSTSFNEAVTSVARQTGFLTRSFDGYSLNFYADRYQDFLSAQEGDSVVIRHTPSVSLSSLNREIGKSPLYFSFDASADGLSRAGPGFSTPAFSERLDFHPAITVQAPDFWDFHLTPVFGVEATRYGTSLLGPDHPITRLLGDFSFDIRPPSFERVFRRRVGHYRLKHVIEPDIRYNLVRAANPQLISDVVRFDDMDILAETNEIEYSLTSTLYGHREMPRDQGEKPQARELLSLSVTQKYYFDPTFGGALRPGQNLFSPTIDLTGFAFAQGRRLSPLVSVLKIAPFSNYDTELRADFDPDGGVLNAGVTSAVHHGKLGLGATDFFISRTEELGFVLPVAPKLPISSLPSFNLLNTHVSYGNSNHKGFSGAVGVNYNLSEGLANAVVAQFTYNFSCFGVEVGYNRFNLGPLRHENRFQIAISLSNVGSFGTLRPHDRIY